MGNLPLAVNSATVGWGRSGGFVVVITCTMVARSRAATHDGAAAIPLTASSPLWPPGSRLLLLAFQ